MVSLVPNKTSTDIKGNSPGPVKTWLPHRVVGQELVLHQSSSRLNQEEETGSTNHPPRSLFPPARPSVLHHLYPFIRVPYRKRSRLKPPLHLSPQKPWARANPFEVLEEWLIVGHSHLEGGPEFIYNYKWGAQLLAVSRVGRFSLSRLSRTERSFKRSCTTTPSMRNTWTHSTADNHLV